MAAEPQEQFELGLDDKVEQFLQRDISQRKAKTANWITLILVCGVVMALVGYTVIAWFKPQVLTSVGSFYEKWLTVVGSLVGAALGFYFGTTRRDG